MLIRRFRTITSCGSRHHENGEGIATNLDGAWRLINKALAAAHAAAGTDGGLAEDYLDDIHAALARINYKRGGGHGVVVFGGGGGDVGGDWRKRVVSLDIDEWLR